MTDIKNIGTEQRNEKTKDLDLLSTMDILKIMNEEDLNSRSKESFTTN